jgi:hypothetical protein
VALASLLLLGAALQEGQVGHDDRIDRLRWSTAGLTSAESLGLTIEHESFTRQRQTFGRQPIVLSYIRLGSWLLFSHTITWEAAYVAAENWRSDRS